MQDVWPNTYRFSCACTAKGTVSRHNDCLAVVENTHFSVTLAVEHVCAGLDPFPHSVIQAVGTPNILKHQKSSSHTSVVSQVVQLECPVLLLSEVHLRLILYDRSVKVVKLQETSGIEVDRRFP